MANQYQYLIVGSGLTGAVFAHEATKHGASCLVVERRAQSGGNLYCQQMEGILVHAYGAHIFHTSNQTVWEYINRFAQFNHFRNSPLANYNGEIYNMPFNMNTFSKLWGISTPAQAMEILERQRAEVAGEPCNLEEQAIKLVGRDIFEKLIKGYTEKQWGRSCDRLPPSIIKRLPVRLTYDNNYFNDRYQGIPEGGYNTIIENLLKGVEVRLNTDYLAHKQELDSLADKIVYTGMIDQYYGYQLGKLEYRSLRFENEIVDHDNYQGVAVVNYTDPQTPFTRIIEHKHFAFGTQPRTVITREYPAEWQPGMEAYYPVNDEKNQKLLEEYQKLAWQERRVLFCGRLAKYRYYDMDDAIEAVLEISRKEFGSVSERG